MAAELIAGQKPHIDYNSHPLDHLHVAGDRLGGQDRAAGEGRGHRRSRPGKFPFSINGRALGTGRLDRIREDRGRRRPTDRVLGMHIIHAHASDLIQEGVTTMEFAGAREDIARIVARASDVVGSGARSRAQRGEALAELVTSRMRRMSSANRGSPRSTSTWGSG
jgi:dihydrolipoamide dehydrogenase